MCGGAGAAGPRPGAPASASRWSARHAWCPRRRGPRGLGAGTPPSGRAACAEPAAGRAAERHPDARTRGGPEASGSRDDKGATPPGSPEATRCPDGGRRPRKQRPSVPKAPPRQALDATPGPVLGGAEGAGIRRILRTGGRRRRVPGPEPCDPGGLRGEGSPPPALGRGGARQRFCVKQNPPSVAVCSPVCFVMRNLNLFFFNSSEQKRKSER